MAGIGSMLPSTPTGADPVSGGDEQLQGIKTDTRASFVNFIDDVTDKVLKTGPEIDDDANTKQPESIEAVWTYSAELRINGPGFIRLANQVNIRGAETGGSLERAIGQVNAANQVELGDALTSAVIVGTQVTITPPAVLSSTLNVIGTS
ncbi:unnamed protein product, partial [marine sediment metagenome]